MIHALAAAEKNTNYAMTDIFFDNIVYFIDK
jgi:hypothetical protein